jgi:hypothetical protein
VPSRYVACLGLALACILVVAGAALAQDDYKAVLGDEAGVFPGAEFKRIFRFPKATAVMFETGAPPAEISAYYKKDMTARGWKVEVDDANKEASFLLMTKNGRRAIVEAQRGLPGRTGFSISL